MRTYVFGSKLVGLAFVSCVVAFGAVSAASGGLPAWLGDINCDGAVDFRDINPFVAILTTPRFEHLEPIAWYGFDGSAIDQSGNANHGFVEGSLTFGEGIIGQAAQFNGVDTRIALSEPISLAGKDYTLAFWMRVATDDAGQVAYILHSTGASGEDAFAVGLNDAPGSLCICQSGEHLAVAPVGKVCDGVWHHVALTRALANMTVTCYIDGEQFAAGPFSVGEAAPARTCLGGAVDGAPGQMAYVGELDAMRVFDRVISAQEITALAIPRWQQRTTPVAPSGRYGSAATYDAARERIVVFGGWSGSYQNDTWEWDGRLWGQRASDGPAARGEASLAHHGACGVDVLFGGDDNSHHALGDTWLWDGSAWEPSDGGPSARWGAGMAYDSARQKIVLFGGASNEGGNYQVFGDTWEWDCATGWVLVKPYDPNDPNSLCARQHAKMTFDKKSGLAVLHGGHRSDPIQDYGDTWGWDGDSWHLLSTEGPTRGWGHVFEYDPSRGICVLFGGSTHGQDWGDTWEWDGSTWHARDLAGPGPRSEPAAGYDTARGRLVLFGGYSTMNDMWEYVLPR